MVVYGPAPPLAAQDGGEGCTYTACALRVEPGGFFSRGTIVRGVGGTEVGELDRSAEVEELFQRDDSAAAYFARFSESDRRADWLERLSGALTLAGVGVMIGAGEHEAWIVGLEAGGFVVGLASNVPRRRASRAFSNAMWWYNRSLVPKDPR